MLPPRKRGRLRSISSRTRASSSKSQTTKTKSSTGELKAASRSLLKVIDECFKTSPQQMGKSTSESGIQRRNRISSDQVSPT